MQGSLMPWLVPRPRAVGTEPGPWASQSPVKQLLGCTPATAISVTAHDGSVATLIYRMRIRPSRLYWGRGSDGPVSPFSFARGVQTRADLLQAGQNPIL
jgi:hypothetical protein